MRSYFPSQADSNYYNSNSFKIVLEFLKSNSGHCQITENKGQLSMKVENIYSIEDALRICKEIAKKAS